MFTAEYVSGKRICIIGAGISGSGLARLAARLGGRVFVSDEKTAITWIRQQLDPDSGGEPKTQGDLTNDFNRVMNRAKHEQPLELIELLKQNFLQDEDGKWYVSPLPDVS